jgi:hypothetical protein
MGTWFKQNFIFVVINTLILLIISIIGWNVRAMVLDMDNKASKDDLKHEVQLLTKEDEKINIKVDNNSKDIDDVKKLFLDEIRLLRVDLNLKVDKP